MTRGRVAGTLNGSSPALLPQGQSSGRATSPLIITGNGENSTRVGITTNGGPERQPSISYGHHRQASIIHGVPHHSRNSSFANSPAMSHRSPQTAGLYNGFPPEHVAFESMADDPPDYVSTASTSEVATSSLRSQSSASTFPGDQGAIDQELSMLTQRRIERTPSVKPRRDHGRSQSRNLPEQISVGEYALHHLFNSVREVFSIKRHALLTYRVVCRAGGRQD